MAPLLYDFEASDDSTYARATRLIASETRPGLVIDLGAGVGAISAMLAPYGFGYLGFDRDEASVSAMQQRGRAARALDLAAPDAADQVLAAVRTVVAGDAHLTGVAAICALDVIEHLADPDRTMSLLATLCRALTHDGSSPPLLVLSVPNVAHLDLAAKLLLGRWDVTDVGLLDRTHVTLFTEQRLSALTGAHGFGEVQRNDVVMPASEQRGDVDLPVFGASTLATLLRDVRHRGDRNGSTYQFVRSYRYTGVAATPGSSRDVVPPRPLLSVVVRTSGDIIALTETLVSIAAQTDRDIEIHVVLTDVDHDTDHDTGRAGTEIRRLVDSFEADFAHRVTILDARRSASTPTIASIAPHGRYITTIDAGQFVTSDWVATFRGIADTSPGSILRAGAVCQPVARHSDRPAVAVGGFRPIDGVGDGYVDLVRGDAAPAPSIAVPLDAIRALGSGSRSIEPSEQLRVVLEVGQFTGVASADRVTTVWRELDGAQPTAAAWARGRDAIVDDIDTTPTVLPPGTLGLIRELTARAHRVESAPDRDPTRADDRCRHPR